MKSYVKSIDCVITLSGQAVNMECVKRGQVDSKARCKWRPIIGLLSSGHAGGGGDHGSRGVGREDGCDDSRSLVVEVVGMEMAVLILNWPQVD